MSETAAVALVVLLTLNVVIGVALIRTGSARRREEARQHVLHMAAIFAAATKAETPQEVIEAAAVISGPAENDDEPYEDQTPMKPDTITDSAGGRHEVFQNEDGALMLRTEDGRELEVL
jgi:hypothetical protein